MLNTVAGGRMSFVRRLRGGLSFGLVAAGLAVMALGRPANAGGGSISVVASDPLDPKIATKLALKFQVYVDAPRTTKELDEFETQLKKANQLLCDASNGIVRIDTLESKAASER